MMIAPMSTQCLNEDLLNRLTEGVCSPVEIAACEDHVSRCQRCRELLDARTTDPAWNNQFLPAFHTISESDFCGSGDGIIQQSALNLLGPTDDPNMLGRIGGYEIVALIGMGGMGIVFKGFDSTLDRFVAIKVMHPHLAVSGAARQRFEREGRAAAAVISDFVLPIFAVSEWQGVPYLVMQYSAGMNLQKRLNLHGPLKLCEVLRIAMQTARGLAAAHSQGLVHRDVKPSNILLDGSVERAALTDFGLARAVDDASVTTTGLIAGTPQYMSPEQARGARVDASSDLFSLGSTMYAMCTGHSPFRADSSYAVLHRIVGDTPQPIREINTEIPDWLEHIITKLLSKDPCTRYESAEQVATLLENCLAHVQQPTTKSLPDILPIDSTRERRWKPLVPVLIALGFLGLIVAGILISLEWNKGILAIECDADDVPIRIMQDEKVVDSLTISRAGKSIRIAAGNYVVEIEQGFENVIINNGLVTLSRGDKQVVSIQTQTKDDFKTASHDLNEPLGYQSPTLNEADDASQRLEINPFQKLFDSIASACGQDKPMPIPTQLIIDCMGDPPERGASFKALSAKQFLFKSIRNVLRTEQIDGSISYELDVDGARFIEEFFYLLTGDKETVEAVLHGMEKDTVGPMIDLRMIAGKYIGKRVKLHCNFQNDGSLEYLVAVELSDKDLFTSNLRRFFERESNYLANVEKDLYVISSPRIGAHPKVDRTGVTVYKNKLYWGSLDRVESVRRFETESPEHDFVR
ncbi:serine/threonine protein kinase [Pirellulaceae bacterium SH449]